MNKKCESIIEKEDFMKKLPTDQEMLEALKSTSTDSISPSWVARKFSLGYNDSQEVFGKMQGLDYINANGLIKVDQYPKDAEF